MAELVVFHHAQGLTPGVRAFAARMTAAGHTAHVPDLYDGRTFDSLEAGLEHVQEVGFETIVERGLAAAAGLPQELVYVGFSLGVMPAQQLAQTRPGARAAVLYHSAVPPEAFGGPWPSGVPLQIHIMDADPLVSPPETDLETARRLDAQLEEATFFSYPGDRHLFADESLPGYDAGAAARAEARVLELLGWVVVVDGNNVMGSRPDGWWKDRAGAARRLVEQIGAWAQDDVIVVFDGAEPPGMPAPDRVEVRFATRRGRDAADDDIAALVAAHPEPARVLVVTSDTELAGRVREHGAEVAGARWLLDRL